MIVPVGVTGSEGSYTVREVLVADDAAFTPGTNAVLMVGAEYDDTSPDSVDEGDAGAIRMSARRELYVQIRDAAGNERGLNVDGSGYLTVNINGTVTVGSHAVTNAGTFAVQVDGSALTALQKIDDPVLVDDAAFTPATSSVMMAGFEYDDTSPDSVDEGDAGAARMSARREVYVQLRDAAGNERGLNVDGSGNITVNVTGTVTVGSHAVTNAGTFAVQVDGSALTSLQLIDNIVNTEDNASGNGDSGVPLLAVRKGTPANTSGTDGDYEFLQMSAGRLWASATIDAALPAGTNAIGKLAANSGVDIGDVDVTSIAAGSNLIGNVGIGVRTSGGATPFYNLDVDETEDAIKASAGQLYSLYLFNTTNAILYCKLYNATTGNTTVGSTTPLITIPVPGNNDTDGAGVLFTWPMGLAFDTAITIAATTAAADNDTGAPGASALLASGAYN